MAKFYLSNCSCCSSSHVILMLMVVVQQQAITSKCKTDSEILLEFRKSLGNSSALSNWDGNGTTPPCSNNKANWAGMLCERGHVRGLQLENMGLNGKMDVDTLSELKSLRSISLMHNHFEGPLPNIKKLGALKTLYLSDNKFSGVIPSNAFESMHSIKKIHLASNNFSGPIPGSLIMLRKLIELMLQDNQFEGQIPQFRQKHLKNVNFADNHLQGPIPPTFSNLKESSFSGNQDLCGPPLKKVCDNVYYSPPSSSSSSSSSKLSVGIIVIVAIASIVTIAALIAAIFYINRHYQQGNEEPLASTSRRTDAPLPIAAHASTSNNVDSSCSRIETEAEATNNRKTGNLTFLLESRDKFDMSDLLKASAELLGSSSNSSSTVSGVFGSSCYKAALKPPAPAHVVVVKRYRQMKNVSKNDFHQHMISLGKLNHPNLLPLVAFYYRKEEKLLITDYVYNGSLAFHLHGNNNKSPPCPDWATRLKIVKGVAKGLCSLYNSLTSLIAPHGHLKSTNVLLTENFEPLLTDYGLLPLVNTDHAREQMIAYKSPEYKLNGRITKKTDVWCFGILILELLTGKYPSNYNNNLLQPNHHQQQQEGEDYEDLPTWVLNTSMVVKEDEALLAEVLDKRMRGTEHSQGEIVKLLLIALSCCHVEIDQRLDIREALEKIQELRETDDNNNTTTILDQTNNNNNYVNDEFYSSVGSESDVRSSRGMSTDFDFNA